MDAININSDLTSRPSLKEVMASFFKGNTPDSTQFLFWKVFQCWALKECTIKAEVSDQDIALFFDQISELVAAAYIEYQADGFSSNPQEGSAYE